MADGEKSPAIPSKKYRAAPCTQVAFVCARITRLRTYTQLAARAHKQRLFVRASPDCENTHNWRSRAHMWRSFLRASLDCKKTIQQAGPCTEVAFICVNKYSNEIEEGEINGNLYKQRRATWERSTMDEARTLDTCAVCCSALGPTGCFTTDCCHVFHCACDFRARVSVRTG